jgi:L-ribulose-5-phosphate 3-epimerase
MQLGALACVAGTARSEPGEIPQGPSSMKNLPIRLGKVVWVGDGQNAETLVREVHQLGLTTCQIGFEHLSLDIADPLRKALDRYGVEGTALSEHNPGLRIFDFYRGPLTIGMIPAATRGARIAALKLAADVAKQAGIPSIHTHCGFIPEDPNDPIYPEAVAAVKEVAEHCRKLGLTMLCETGQETPIAMVRLIDDVGLGNVFVNLDVANLILYGKGNPVDAMDVFQDRVRGIHAKDGRFPTDPRKLGAEAPIGEGRVDFPVLLKRLKQANYKGPMLIEREVGTEEQRRKDIVRSKLYLENLIARTYS